MRRSHSPSSHAHRRIPLLAKNKKMELVGSGLPLICGNMRDATYCCGLGGAALGVVFELGGIGGFWVVSLGVTGFASGVAGFTSEVTGFTSGATVFRFGSTVLALGVAVFTLGSVVLMFGACVAALGGCIVALGACVLALGACVAALGACTAALGAGFELGAARCAKHAPVNEPSSMLLTSSFLMPPCLRSEVRCTEALQANMRNSFKIGATKEENFRWAD